MTEDNEVKKPPAITTAELNRDLRVVEVLNQKGISPGKQILQLIAKGELSTKDQLRAWEILLKYCEPQVASQQVQVLSMNAELEKELKNKTSEDLQRELTIFDFARSG